MFGQTWDKAEATIVDRETKYTGDGSVSTHTFVADVRLASGEMFRAIVHEPNIALDFWPPDIRDVVSVLVRPKDRKVKFDKDDERISVKAHDAAKRRSFDEAGRQPVGTPAEGWPSTTNLPDSVASTLAQLGIVGGGPVQIFTTDSADAQAAMAAFTNFGAQAVPTADARLAQLQTLRERGLLTAEEYAEQRQRILNEI